MEHRKLKVLINGMGNIGSTLANLILQYQKELHVDQIFVYKRSLQPWNKVEREMLIKKGVVICSENGQGDTIKLSEILMRIDYIFEATANGVGNENKQRYEAMPNLKGSCAQGSEKGYGIPFMSGVNDQQIVNQKFVQIVSCNTHGTAALLQAFCGKKLEQLNHADVVVVRRSEDLGNHERLVSGNVVARHLDPMIGTHHAIDVVDMFKTLGVDCNLTSSDITTPSQLTHAVRFNIEFKEEHSLDTIDALIQNNKFLAKTKKFDSNVIFELGRRYGFNGRLFAHAIVVSENLLVTKNTVKGWAFVPQEGNTILSTIHAFLLQMYGQEKKTVFEKMCNDLLQNEW